MAVHGPAGETRLVPYDRVDGFQYHANLRALEMSSFDSGYRDRIWSVSRQDADQFLESFKTARAESTKEAKVLRECFAGHTRSKMALFMALMQRHDMPVDDDLTAFSPELAGRLRNLRWL